MENIINFGKRICISAKKLVFMKNFYIKISLIKFIFVQFQSSNAVAVQVALKVITAAACAEIFPGGGGFSKNFKNFVALFLG